MFFMSNDLTTILDSQNHKEHKEGFFHSKHYAKFFVTLGQICLTLSEKKRLTFLSSLKTFAEVNIDNLVEDYEHDILEDEESTFIQK